MKRPSILNAIRSAQVMTWLVTALSIVGLIPVDKVAAQESKQPNFVFFLVDDLGRQDLSCEGSTFYETPNIDRLAESSMRFVNGYAACQVCSPSRAALQTGRTPARFPITDYISPSGSNQPEQWSRNTKLLPASFEKQLPLEETTIAEELQSLGYHTYFAGKWHLGGEGFEPSDQGYEVNVGGFEYGTPPGGYFAPYRNVNLSDGPAGENLPLRLGRETADFVKGQAESDKPFFAMLAFYSVHGPIQSTEALWNKYRNKAEELGLTGDKKRFLFDRLQEVRQVQDHPVYAGMMESLDTAVGTVIDAIEQSGQSEDTIIIFTSDNGGVSSGDGYATSSLPFRGGKGRQWEGGIREPYYIKVPGKTSGETSEFLATGTDFYPTIVELAGGEVEKELDGISLVPVLNGESVEERALFWHYPHYGNQGGEPSAIIRDGDWKLIHYFEEDRDELYNLSTDVGEQQDLASDNSGLARLLRNKLDAWLTEVNARMPSENPKFDQAKYDAGIKQKIENGVPRREKEHANFLKPNFKPSGGWWENRGK